MKIQYRGVSVDSAEVRPDPAEKWFDFVATVAGAIAAVMLILVFLFRVVTVDGQSMVPNLQDGDRLILTDVTTRFKRGEIVVISRSDDAPLVKRVIAVSGDTIDLRDGSVYLNGELLEEPYIDQETYDVSPGPPDFPLTVPRGYVFVMGDNRGNSLDSRSYEVGLVDTHRILGKVLVHLSNAEE
ncbi:MAG: signal peptidase I [Clostridia bacterium]|nr:signal peptidase I [Clostridia bacterium]MBQ8470085.1 signal peptidase I [Clostridia bacterium]MBR1704947.1 signal peptidase I [Clostridia bacterium]